VPGGRIYHLVVVPDLWKGMMATDWRNQSGARNAFARHLESELEKEILEHRERVHRAAEAGGLEHDFGLAQGDPARLLLECARTQRFDLVILGARRPRGVLGLRSRMLTATVMRELEVPLMIVPAGHE